MKTALFVSAGLLLLLLISFLVVIPEFAVNPYYDIRYRWSHLPTQTASSVDPSIFEKFSSTDSGGSYSSGDRVSFLYETRYDKTTRTYYYKFANNGRGLFCLSSRGFAYLIGAAKIRIEPGETKYFLLKDDRPPRIQSESMRVYDSCGLIPYGGSGFEITAPTK